MNGELENPPKAEKNLSILWKRSDIELQSISVHYERLKTCPDRLHWCCVSSTSTVLAPSVSFCERKNNNHAAVAFAPFLLILLKSGPTDDETFLPFSGSLWNRFLIFKAEKTSAHLGFVALADPHITYPDMKTKGTTTSKKCHQHIILWATPAAEVRQLQDVRPCQSWPGGFSLIHTQTGGEI